MERIGFLDPYAPISIHERNLPHWHQTGVMVFVTWRLADALPAEKIATWRMELAEWRRLHPPPWTPEVLETYRTQFPARFEQWLDAGHGECLLREAEIAPMVEGALRYFSGERYDLLGYVVMPNHVHVVLRLRNDWRLESVVQSWKSWTAREINRLLSRKGRLWQDGYWDRLIRDEAHLGRCLSYIARNPIKARLPTSVYRLWIDQAWSS